MHMEVRALFGRFVWHGVNIDHNPSFPRFEDQSHAEAVRTQPGRTFFKCRCVYNCMTSKHYRSWKNFLPLE